VQDARRRLWQLMPSFTDLDSLNAWLEDHCLEQWEEIQHGNLPGTIADVHAAERSSLMPLFATVQIKEYVRFVGDDGSKRDAPFIRSGRNGF
jgi:hypothetical protein